MANLTRDITSSALQIDAAIQKLSKGQFRLLKEIRNCITEKRPLNFEAIVNVYTESIRSSFWRDEYNHEKGQYFRVEKIILSEFKKNSSCWVYTIRPLVRQWFLTNIGILVLKNQLVIIPTVDLGEEVTNG